MECTKGKLRVSSSFLIVDKEARIIANVEPIGVEGITTTYEEGIANAKELVRRWNAFEKNGLVDELRAACDEGLAECERVKMDCKCKWKNLDSLLGRIERIEAAIAKAT